MKKEYDFSKVVRGKFYNPDGEFNLPTYINLRLPNFLKTSDWKETGQNQNRQSTAKERYGYRQELINSSRTAYRSNDVPKATEGKVEP